MPLDIPYQPVLRTLRCETDVDGSLHIAIPRQTLGVFGISPVVWIASLLFPPAFVITAICAYHDLRITMVASFVSTLLAALFPCSVWIKTHKPKCEARIHATPDRLTILRKFRFSTVNSDFSRAQLRAIDIQKDSGDMISWSIRIHGRYEWEFVLSGLDKSNAEKTADRLRTFFNLPKSPTPQ